MPDYRSQGSSFLIPGATTFVGLEGTAFALKFHGQSKDEDGSAFSQCFASEPLKADGKLPSMRVNEVQREALRVLVWRFLSAGEPTPRIHLVKKLKNHDLVDDLVPVILRNPVGDKLFPTAVAFECCGDPEALHTARKSVETVISTLKKLFEVHVEKMDFTVAEVQEQAQTMFPELQPVTIKLGLYLVQDFSGIHAGMGGMWPNLTSVRIHEKLGLLENIAAAWDEHIAKYSLYLAGNSNTEPQTATGTPSNLTSPSPLQKNTEWDFFISHASEDKLEIARPLADALVARDLKVWYDDFSLAVGDSLRESIDRGGSAIPTKSIRRVD